jgi:hypothetical protein
VGDITESEAEVEMERPKGGEGGGMASKKMASSDGKLMSTNSMQFLRRNLFLPALSILKHKIITIDHTGTAIDDGALHDLA